jgi:hypothetical protein
MEEHLPFGTFHLDGNPGPPARADSAKQTDLGFERPLSFGEREALAMQASNRQAVGMTPGEFEARNLAIISVDADIKRPRLFGPGR